MIEMQACYRCSREHIQSLTSPTVLHIGAILSPVSYSVPLVYYGVT